MELQVPEVAGVRFELDSLVFRISPFGHPDYGVSHTHIFSIFRTRPESINPWILLLKRLGFVQT